MTALRDLDYGIPARASAPPRPSLAALAPGLDACALIVAVGVAAAHPTIVAFALLAFLGLNVDGSRSHRLDPRVGDEIGWLLSRTAVPLLGLLTLASLDVLPWRVGNIDRLLLLGSLGIALVLAGRAAAYAIGRAARARGMVSEPTLVVGAGPIAVELARALDRHPEYGLRPIGFIEGPTGEEELPLPLLGGPHDLDRVVAEYQVRRLVVAFGRAKDREVTALLRALERLPVEVHIVPRFFELGSVPQGAAEDLCGIPLVHLRRPAHRATSRIAKRAFDIVVASALLILTTPVLLVAAAAIRVTSRGPVLFRQARIGKGGGTFQILKLRTMSVEEDPEPSWTVAHHRVTPVGRVLRRTSIDELPQLINVIRGEMSLVGPRPERPHFVEQFTEALPGYADRHRVEGGITGLAQVHGRSRGLDSIPERIRLDNAYIESRSLWGDIVIMLRTIEVLFRGDRDA